MSVTQQFNTTTSMGRLTLNVLLSFAQFEREVTGERIRDKIAASKKKGMWMGGMPPLGYDVKDRKLVVNEDEARPSSTSSSAISCSSRFAPCEEELAAAGIGSKRRVRPDGTVYGGQRFSRGALYLMLQNRIYRGEIRIRAMPIRESIRRSSTGAVGRSAGGARRQPRERATGATRKQPSLLAGLVFDETGERLTPTYASRRARATATMYRHPS